MKNNLWRKLTAYLLLVVLIITGIGLSETSIAMNAKAATASVVVHYKGSYTSPNIYYWNRNGESNNPVSWPGTKMNAESNQWFGYSFSNTQSVNLIFNQDGSQTADLFRTSGEWWYKDSQWYDYNPENVVTEDFITIHFKSPWNGANIYHWDTQPSGVTITWPGTAMTKENGWYKYVFNNATSTNLIFNYGGNQTTDLSRTKGEWWYKNNTWFANNPEITITPIPSEAPNITPTPSATPIPTITPSITPGPSVTPTPSVTPIPTMTPSITPIPSVTPIPTITPTITPTPSITLTPTPGLDTGVDFRDESIYFVMITRFYDGDPSNNVHCWDEVAAMKNSNDAAWRGDFKGLIEKLDYIKALGFSAIWITPVVKNMSGYDYHGYHAIDFTEVDRRYESDGITYQDFIDAAHAKGLKVIQDIVLNHTGNFGEENLYPMFTKDETKADTADNIIRIDAGKLPANYNVLSPAQQYQARISAMKEDANDTLYIYHHEKSLSWEGYTVQTGQIAGDCVDLNTENPTVADYLTSAYQKYIDMGVDSFRIDTVKHISRLTFNKYYIPAFKAAGGEDFFIFGEVATRYRQVWNSNIPAISTPFYTWAENKSYAWGDTTTNMNSTVKHWNDNQNVNEQPTSNNHLLNGNTYHAPDTSTSSGLGVIDFPMHWNFSVASDAFRIGVEGDKYYSDATWNVTYVDSHDYAPDGAPENQRFAGTQDTWAENLNLMFTFRGIPCVYYGSEIEFMKGAVIDPGPTKPLSETGRAYFGDHIEGSVSVTDFAEYTNATGAIASTLNHPLSLHIQRLNKIRRAIPALRKGQYSTEGVSGEMAFKRRYTDEKTGVDSFVLVSITNGATFNGIPNGTYKDAITGDIKVVTNNSLSIPSAGKGNMRVYVLDLPGNPAPGKIGVSGKYLK